MIINYLNLWSSEAHFAKKCEWRGTLTTYDTLVPFLAMVKVLFSILSLTWSWSCPDPGPCPYPGPALVLVLVMTWSCPCPGPGHGSVPGSGPVLSIASKK